MFADDLRSPQRGQDDSDNPMIQLLYRYAELMRTVQPEHTLSASDRVTITIATRFIYTRTLEKTGRVPYAEVSDAAARVQYAMLHDPSGRVALRNRIYFDRPCHGEEQPS